MESIPCFSKLYDSRVRSYSHWTMSRSKTLRVVIIKPSKYGIHGDVERFRRGFMPNSTITYLRSMTPENFDGCSIQTFIVDEYIQTNLDYLKLLRSNGEPTLL